METTIKINKVNPETGEVSYLIKQYMPDGGHIGIGGIADIGEEINITDLTKFDKEEGDDIMG